MVEPVSDRLPIVAANWKMHTTIGTAVDLAAEIKSGLADLEGVDTVLCPPFTALKPVGDLVRYSNVRLGAQTMHSESEGAYTGEISAGMLLDLGCEFVILGHSERRRHCGESDELIASKVRAALAAGLTPILCVGETLEQREHGAAEEVVHGQLDGGLRGLSSELSRVVLAYEPVWAIGTGRSATADEAQAAHFFIRKWARQRVGDRFSGELRIQYGGSVKPENAAELFLQPDVDGGLVGGASLDAGAFVQIVRAAAPELQ
jgi:triosephosphate isomerase